VADRDRAVIRAVFRDGPADGYQLGLAGRVPGYLMLIKPPEEIDSWPWIIVGVDFDDHWPDQQRYELDDELLDGVGEDGFVPTVVYRFAS
jgi:hypothetical protein